MIIAIDGPAGAGKSTVAKKLAQKMGFLYIDTGAMYRAGTLKALENKADFKDEKAIVEIARAAKIDLKSLKNGSEENVFLDGRDVTEDIRHPRITKYVSDVAKIPDVREAMLRLQRALGGSRDSVMEGRDIGTVVFPNADKKFFLDATGEERTKRRFKELKLKGQDVTEKDIECDIKNRDKIDSTRTCAPLRRAEDAIYIDTTNMGIEEVVDTLYKYVENTKS
ncbi:MAG: (d)CMP kinase [Candidatus Omnitrophica bacterium]|nr:(d)CMP kinase [Candidatus Omnitrophota bacterium]